jgi:predicted enzyme related to lactoylglutathione lyase
LIADTPIVITAVHLLQYSRDAEADRGFLRDVLGWPSVEDVGSEPGWLIFALPPAELGVHPTEEEPLTELHLMCDDIEATVTDLQAKGVEITGPVEDRGYGLATGLRLPSGATIGLYEPRHLSPLDL